MYLIPVLFLLLLAVFFIFVRHQSGRPVQKSRRSRNEGWHDSGSEFSILSIAPSQDSSDISSDSAHQPSYLDPTHTTDSFVSTGSVDYGSSSDAGGGLGSALADSVDWSSSSGDTHDSGTDFGSSSDYGGSSDFGSSSDFSSSSDFGSSDSGSSFSDGSN